MVEFVLVFFLLMIIMFTIIDFGIMLNRRLIVASAAREGSRIAAVEGGAKEAVFNRIEEQLAAGGIESRLIDIDIHPQKAAYSDPIKVEISYNHEFITPLVRRFAGSHILIQVGFVTRSENVK